MAKSSLLRSLLRVSGNGRSPGRRLEVGKERRLLIAERVLAAALWGWAISTILRVGTPVVRLAVSLTLIGAYIVLRALRLSDEATALRKAGRGLLVWLLLVGVLVVAGWIAAELFSQPESEVSNMPLFQRLS